MLGWTIILGELPSNTFSSILRSTDKCIDLTNLSFVYFILACINITGWAFVILVTLFTLIQTSFQQSPATVCTVESPTLNYPYSEKMPSLPSYSSQKQLIAEPEPTACTRTSSLRPTKSWCSESWSEDNDERSSFEPVPLDDLPHIQVGMSRMDLTFAARSYEEIKL